MIPMTTLTKTLALLVLAACGDNFAVPDAATDGPPGDAGPTPPRAVIVAGDFTPGNPGVMSVIDVDAGTVTANVAPAMAIGNDPVLRHVPGELLVVNRGTGNNVTILDADDFSLIEQLGTGPSSNPQDVAVIGDKVFVATFGNKGAVMLTRGGAGITEIDLSADDPDGKPNCNSIFEVAGDLYISCELLDDTQQFLPPRGPGRVYVVNPSSLAITNTITLSNVNPFGMFEQIPQFALNAGDLVIPTVDFADGSGCLERITTGPSAAAAGCLIENAELGNFASRVSMFAVEFTGPVAPSAAAAPIVVPAMLYAVVPGTDFMSSDVRAYYLDMDLLDPNTVNDAEVIGDVVACPSGQLVVADKTPNASGVRIRDGGILGELLPIGLSPQSTRGLVCY